MRHVKFNLMILDSRLQHRVLSSSSSSPQQQPHPSADFPGEVPDTKGQSRISPSRLLCAAALLDPLLRKHSTQLWRLDHPPSPHARPSRLQVSSLRELLSGTCHRVIFGALELAYAGPRLGSSPWERLTGATGPPFVRRQRPSPHHARGARWSWRIDCISFLHPGSETHLPTLLSYPFQLHVLAPRPYSYSPQHLYT